MSEVTDDIVNGFGILHVVEKGINFSFRGGQEDVLHYRINDIHCSIAWGRR